MSESQPGVVPPGVVPPAPPAPPAAGPAPAPPAPPVPPQPAPPAPAPVPPPAAPAAPPAPQPPGAPESSILEDPAGAGAKPPVPPAPPAKPTVEALKVPAGSLLKADELAEIVAESTTQEEAQKNLEFAAKRTQRTVDRSKAVNTERITQLKADPEFGGQKWAESKELFRKGVVQFFGEEFAKDLVALNLDGHPAIFKHVVRAMRAANPKPAVKGDEVPISRPAGPESGSDFASRIYKTMPYGKKPGSPGSAAAGTPNY